MNRVWDVSVFVVILVEFDQSEYETSRLVYLPKITKIIARISRIQPPLQLKGFKFSEIVRAHVLGPMHFIS